MDEDCVRVTHGFDLSTVWDHITGPSGVRRHLILCFDGDRLRTVEYRDTEHYRITKDFLDAPERYFSTCLNSAMKSELQRLAF